MLMRALFLALALSVAPLLAASPFARSDEGIQLAAREGMRPEPQGILPGARGPKVGNQQAASRVRQAYGSHKILSVQLIEGKGPPVYRVKTLSEEGVVKYVFVDGTSGDLFE